MYNVLGGNRQEVQFRELIKTSFLYDWQCATEGYKQKQATWERRCAIMTLETSGALPTCTRTQDRLLTASDTRQVVCVLCSSI